MDFDAKLNTSLVSSDIESATNELNTSMSSDKLLPQYRNKKKKIDITTTPMYKNWKKYAYSLLLMVVTSMFQIYLLRQCSDLFGDRAQEYAEMNKVGSGYVHAIGFMSDYKKNLFIVTYIIIAIIGIQFVIAY